MPGFRFLKLGLTIAAFLILCAPAVAKKCDNPPCGGGNDGGGSQGEVMTLAVDVDWLGYLTSTGDFETEVQCNGTECGFGYSFAGDLPALRLPPEFVQHWDVADAEACFGGINADGSATVAMQAVSVRTFLEGDGVIGFWYTGWTTAGSEEPVLYRTVMKAPCVGPQCPVLPPSSGGVVSFEDLDMWLNAVDDATKKGRNKRAEPCYCVQGCDGGIPGADSVTVTRP
jgi:hypothetical protein